MTRVRHLLVAAGLTLVVVGLVGGAGITPSAAQEVETTYAVTADATSVLIELQFPDAGLVVGADIVNATPARALAAVDSVGTSRALASAGYPGDVAFTLPGTVTGVLSGIEGARELVPLLPPVPDYPLAAQSDLVNPSSSTESGAFTVSASTSEFESVAATTLGVDQLGLSAVSTAADAVATFDPESRVARSEASAETTGLRIAGVLDLSQRTTGSISVSPGGTPQFASDTFFGISLLGSQIKIGFGPDGLTAAGNSLVDRLTMETVLAALSAEGISFEYIPETVSEDGSTLKSAGMRVTQTFVVPDDAAFLDEFGLPFSADVGRVITSVTFGQVVLRGEAANFEVPSFGGDTPTTPIGSGGVSTPITPSTPSTGSGSGSVSSPSPTVARPTGTVATPTTPATTPTQVAPPTRPAGSSRAPQTLTSTSFYLVLVGSAMAALGSSRLIGNLAVRLRFAG